MASDLSIDVRTESHTRHSMESSATSSSKTEYLLRSGRTGFVWMQEYELRELRQLITEALGEE